jgi:hypothetical protein
LRPTRNKYSRLGDEGKDELARQHARSLAHQDLEPPLNGAFNGPTEGLNLCVKMVKRARPDFTRFDHSDITIYQRW